MNSGDRINQFDPDQSISKKTYRREQPRYISSAISWVVETFRPDFRELGEISLKAIIIIIALVSITLGRFGIEYFGMIAVIPLLAGYTFYYFGKKLFNPQRKLFVVPLSILVGHACWMLAGAILLASRDHISPDNRSSAIELALYIIGIIWLGAKSGKTPAICMLIYSAITLLMNVIQIVSFSEAAPMQKTLMIHILLRIGVIITLFMALNATKAKEGKMISPHNSIIHNLAHGLTSHSKNRKLILILAGILAAIGVFIQMNRYTVFNTDRAGVAYRLDKLTGNMILCVMDNCSPVSVSP